MTTCAYSIHDLLEAFLYCVFYNDYKNNNYILKNIYIWQSTIIITHIDICHLILA